MNVIFIGYRGCGKSSVGRAVAQRLGWMFVDTDDEIAASAGMPVSRLFAEEGEERFREREVAAIIAACAGAQRVISVGGGAILRAENRERLRASGRCIWLAASVDALRSRLSADGATPELRPSLTGRGVLQEIAEVLAAREPLYAATAHEQIATDGRTIDDLAAEIAGRIVAILPRDSLEERA